MFKKICALVLAIAMVLAMGSAAMAGDTNTGDSGNTGSDTSTHKDVYTGSGAPEAINVAKGTKIPLVKSIVFFNANGSDVYEPNITFHYDVAPDTNVAADGSTATVTDDKSVHDDGKAVTRNVYPGPTGGVTGCDIPFAPTHDVIKTKAEGVEVEESGNLTVVFNDNTFTKPGIYRYVITESVKSPATSENDNAKLQAAGLTARDPSYDNTRYLDVYIHYNESGALEMYGAVIFKTTKTSTDAGKDSITTSTKKTTGFEPTSDGDSYSYENDKNVDKYTTYDFSVKKTVSGSMADKNHEFPFYVNITNSIAGAKYTYFAKNATTGTAENITGGAITKGTGTKASDLMLKDGEYIKFVGVPSAQGTNKLSVVVKEFNDTYDQYTASTSAKQGTLSIANTNDATTADKTGVMTATSGSMITESFDIYTNDDIGQILTIDNNLTEISPTGVVLRVAPYVLILGAGLALLLISRRRKIASEEE